jgi:hypothetical protein
MYGTYCRLNVSVLASNIEVIRKARLKLVKSCWHDRSKRDLRHMYYREILAEHEDARKLFSFVQSGL